MSKPVVAIVEDEEDLCRIYSAFLRSKGYNYIHITRTGEEMVERVRDGLRPSIMVVDYRLPGINGLEAAIEVAKVSLATSVIVASADQSAKREAEVLGFTFLQKPFSLAVMLGVIEERSTLGIAPSNRQH